MSSRNELRRLVWGVGNGIVNHGTWIWSSETSRAQGKVATLTPARTLSSQQAPASWVFFWVLGCWRQTMRAPRAPSAVFVLGSDCLSVSIQTQTWSWKCQTASGIPRALHSAPCDGCRAVLGRGPLEQSLSLNSSVSNTSPMPTGWSSSSPAWPISFFAASHAPWVTRVPCYTGFPLGPYFY